MLLADAVDRAVSRIDFGLLAGKNVYFDTSYMNGAVDKDYIISTMRQHMLACGCILKEKRDDAIIVVEARVGTVGTDRHELLFGTPATSVSLGALSTVPGTPTIVPEIALAKRTDQAGVAKIAVFAYERDSGRPIWQSGSDPVISRSRDLWVFGTGPFQRGTIYDGTQFAGDELRVPLVGQKSKRPPVRVARERFFNPTMLASGEASESSPVAGGPAASAVSTASRSGDPRPADAPPMHAAGRAGEGTSGQVRPAAFENLFSPPGPSQGSAAGENPATGRGPVADKDFSNWQSRSGAHADSPEIERPLDTTALPLPERTAAR